MSYVSLVDHAPEITVQTNTAFLPLRAADGVWHGEDIAVRLQRTENGTQVFLRAENTAIRRVWLSWPWTPDDHARLLGDAWERGYGDLEWRGMVPERVMPWYVLVSEGDCTNGYGVMTGPSAMCFWQADRHRLSLCLDVRNGGSGVLLSGRELLVATVVSRGGKAGETAFEAAKAFCRLLCEKPRLPQEPVYGSNNWYYAYGESAETQILRDADLLRELTAGNAVRPFMVIDDGWQIMHNTNCNGGPWDRGNYRFSDMKRLADDIRERGLRPGLWYRPLSTYACFPEECYRVDVNSDNGARTLDPSHPYVLEQIEKTTRHLTEWGYELLKHDFSTYDIFGRWGFSMDVEMTNDGWHFYDRTQTTAEIILNLYRAIRRGAGENTLVIGCNTVSHLAAGIFEIQRTGDDTSGREWERTRKMGVNTLAFRMPQNGVFYACDADCAGLTGKIDWQKNREWISLLAVSGTPMFLSMDPDVITDEQKQFIRNAFAVFLSNRQEAVPLDWMETTCPEHWSTANGPRQFCFPTELP